MRDHAVRQITGGKTNAWQTLTVRCRITVVEGATLAWLQERHCSRDELADWLVGQFTAMTSVRAGQA